MNSTGGSGNSVRATGSGQSVVEGFGWAWEMGDRRGWVELG